MILLWGVPQDSPLAAVHNALQRRGAPVEFLDQREVLATEVELCVDADIRGALQIGDRKSDLGAVTAVYLRPYDWRHLPEIEKAGPGSPAWRHAFEVQDALLCWLELTSAQVINRLPAMAVNNSKPWQACLIRSLGFDIPDTLITTDPSTAQEFWEKHGTVIYKSISSVRSIVSRLTPGHVRRLDDITWCPTQFQRYIPGHDYRVHVVGDEVFACEIISEADDYRYATRQGVHVDLRSYQLPRDCADRCRELAAAMDLAVAGIDLRRTPEGQWYCFEVNPSPAFTYYQGATGQPIDDAIAQLLVERSMTDRKRCPSDEVPIFRERGFMAHPSPLRQHSLGPTVVSQHEVLRLQECEAVRDQVFALKEYWTSRSEGGGFFTLGVASYLDAVERHDAYVKEAREINPILRAHFDWLYERVRKGLEDLLGKPVSYGEGCALPGFHIFRYQGADLSSDRPSSRAHFDMQWRHAMPRCHPEETLSFTLPIEEPLGGCSLEIWPIHCNAIQPGFDALKYAASGPSQTLWYVRGRMVVHDGLLLHAIGQASIATPQGHRITLQGHGAKVSGNWKLYW